MARIRRVLESPSSRVAVPADIAAGPEIRRWADPETVDTLARLRAAPAGTVSSQLLRDAEGNAMVTARRRWVEARDEWAAEAGFTRREGMAMVPSRRPYWSSRTEPKSRFDCQRT